MIKFTAKLADKRGNITEEVFEAETYLEAEVKMTLKHPKKTILSIEEPYIPRFFGEDPVPEDII